MFKFFHVALLIVLLGGCAATKPRDLKSPCFYGGGCDRRPVNINL